MYGHELSQIIASHFDAPLAQVSSDIADLLAVLAQVELIIEHL